MAGMWANIGEFGGQTPWVRWPFNPEEVIGRYCRENPVQHFKLYTARSLPGWGKNYLKPNHEKKIRGYFGVPDSEWVFLAFDADLSIIGPSKYGFALCTTGVYAANTSFERFKKVPKRDYQCWASCLEHEAYIFEFEEVDEPGEVCTTSEFYRHDPDGSWIHLFGYDYLVDSDFVRHWLLGLDAALKDAWAGR